VWPAGPGIVDRHLSIVFYREVYVKSILSRESSQHRALFVKAS